MPRKTPLVYGVFDAWWSDGACASLGRVCKIGNKMRSSVFLNEVEVVCWCSTTRPRHASGLGSAVLCRESRLPFFHAFRLLVHVHYLPRYNCYPLSPRQHGHMRCRLITTQDGSVCRTYLTTTSLTGRRHVDTLPVQSTHRSQRPPYFHWSSSSVGSRPSPIS
jgi:hypothetical protein